MNVTLKFELGPGDVEAIVDVSTRAANDFLGWLKSKGFEEEMKETITEMLSDRLYDYGKFLEDEREAMLEEKADRELHAVRDGD